MKNMIAKFVNKTFDLIQKHSLLISIILPAILFIIFYPLFIGTNDEHCYLRNAYNIPRDGIIYEDYAEGLKSVDYGNGYTTKCMLGTSFILIPITYLGWKAVFGFVFILFSISTYIFHKILKKLDINPIFTILYALFPAFIYLQRTIFTETFTILITLLGVYFFIKSKSLKDILISGFFFGLAIFIRYTQIIFVVFFGLYLVYELFDKYKTSKKFPSIEFKRIILFVLPMIPFVPVILYINNALWGGPFENGYDFEESSYEEALKLSVFPFMFIRYFLVLNSIYPLMWLTSVFGKVKYKFLFLASTNGLIFFYCLYKLYPWEGRPLDLILGIRYLLPVIPILLILYSSFIQRFLTTKYKTLVQAYILTMIFASLFTAIFVHFKHQFEYLKPRNEILSEMKSNIPDGSFIIGEYDDFVFLMEMYNDKYYEDVGNIDRLEDSKSKIIFEKEVFIAVIKEPNKSGRPSTEMNKFLEEYKNEIQRIDSESSSKYIEIYKIVN